MKKITVLLTSGTVGTFIISDHYNCVGTSKLVALHDENGLPIEEFGEVEEMLEIENF